MGRQYHGRRKRYGPSKRFQLEQSIWRWFMETRVYINNYWVSWIWSNGSSTLEADGVGAGDNCGDLAAFDDEALGDEVEYTSSSTRQEPTIIIRQSSTTGKAAKPPTKLNTQRIPPSHKFTTARGRFSRQIETRQTPSQRITAIIPHTQNSLSSVPYTV